MYRCLLGEKVSIFCFAQVSCCQVKDRNAFLKSASEYKGLKIWCCLFHLKNSKCFPKWLINRPVLCEAGSVCWAPALGMKTKLNQRKINVSRWIWGREVSPAQAELVHMAFQVKLLPVSGCSRIQCDKAAHLQWRPAHAGMKWRWLWTFPSLGLRVVPTGISGPMSII